LDLNLELEKYKRFAKTMGGGGGGAVVVVESQPTQTDHIAQATPPTNPPNNASAATAFPHR